MNQFGRIFRIMLFGESHGECVGVVIDGCPAGLTLSKKDFILDIKRRHPRLKGTTQRRETDEPLIQSGLWKQKTTGAPLLITIKNKDTRFEDYLPFREIPRPGHADFTASKKYGGYNDTRGGGQFSGRLTVALVCAGVIAKKILTPVEIEASLLRAEGTTQIERVVQAAIREKDSIGGIIECRAKYLPVGLGEPFFDSVESQISHLVFSIPGVKGIEFGSGFSCSKMRGSECNDTILDTEGKTATNHSGGINGGITNGNELVFRIAIKPPSSINKPQRTINLQTGEEAILSVKGRHDACIALRTPVIVEAVTAIVLADFMLIEQKIPRVME